MRGLFSYTDPHCLLSFERPCTYQFKLVDQAFRLASCNFPRKCSLAIVSLSPKTSASLMNNKKNRKEETEKKIKINAFKLYHSRRNLGLQPVALKGFTQ